MFSLFGKGDKYYLNHSNDNRIYIYDINTNKQLYNYIEKNYLTHSYLCNKWEQNNNKNDIGLYSVGTSDGLIIIWDFKRGVVINTIGNKNDNILPSDIFFTNNNKNIVVSYLTSSQINEYDITTGELIKTYKGFKKGTNKLAKNPTSNAFVAVSGSIKYFDTDKSSKFKISSSFSGNVTSVNFTNCGNYLICTLNGSHNSDDLVIYNLSPEILSTATTDSSYVIEPICSYPINGTIKSISLTNSILNNYELICLFENGTSSIIHLPMNDILNKNFNTIKQIQITSNIDGTPIDNIISVSFPSSIQNESTHDKYSFLLAIGKYSSPQFFKHSYSLNDIQPIELNTLTTTTTTTVTSSSSSEYQLYQLAVPFRIQNKNDENNNNNNNNNSENSANILNSHTEPTVIGPFETGGTKRPYVPSENTTDSNNDTITNSNKKLKLIQENNLTLEERLRNIHTTLTQLETHPSLPGDIEGGILDNGSGDNLSGSLLPTSDSLVLLIEQALQTSDDVLFEQCLTQSSIASSTDSNIIIETIQRLSLSKILVLLNKLILKFNKNSSRSLIITRWIYTILKQHSSYLLSVSNLNQQLAALYNMLENRLNIYVKLASLNGRLDLIMSQIISSNDRNDHHERNSKESNSKDKQINTNENTNQKKNNKKPKQILYEE